MFESLTAEQIIDIHYHVIKFKQEFTNKYGIHIHDMDSMVISVLHRYVQQLAKRNVKATIDIKNAVKVFAALSMDDEEFMRLKRNCNSDYNKIAKLYSVNPIIPKYRYKLLLLKRIKLSENISSTKTENTINLTKKKSI